MHKRNRDGIKSDMPVVLDVILDREEIPISGVLRGFDIIYVSWEVAWGGMYVQINCIM